jgi:vancomycin permeability regulator SanA
MLSENKVIYDVVIFNTEPSYLPYRAYCDLGYSIQLRIDMLSENKVIYDVVIFNTEPSYLPYRAYCDLGYG